MGILSNPAATIGLLALAVSLASPLARAQQARTGAALTSELTWTNNAGLDNREQASEDWILEVAPRVDVRTRGTRFRAEGEIGASAIEYMKGSAPDRVLPRVRLFSSLEAIEQLAFIDARVTTALLAEDPFGARAQAGASSVNTYTATTAALRPYVQWRLSPRTQARIQTERAWVSSTGDRTGLDNGRFTEHLARLDVLPQPVGFTLEASHNVSQFSGEGSDALKQTLGRAIVSWAPDAQWLLNVRAGYERNTFGTQPLTDNSIYGAGVQWHPTERTALKAEGEHRYFGTGWEALATHRMPKFALNVRAARTLSSYPEELARFTEGGNVFSLLDAMLTTRYPDALERGRAVQDLIDRQGLPAQAAGPLTIYTQQAFVTTDRSLTLGFLGVRNTLSWRFGTQHIESALPGVVLISPTGVGDTKQRTNTLTYAHQWSAVTALSVTAARSWVSSLGDPAGAHTETSALRVTMTRRVSPKTEVSAGFRRQWSDASDATDYSERAVFAGLNKRF